MVPRITGVQNTYKDVRIFGWVQGGDIKKSIQYVIYHLPVCLFCYVTAFLIPVFAEDNMKKIRLKQGFHIHTH